MLVQSGRCPEDTPQVDAKDTNPSMKKHPLLHLPAAADLPNHLQLKIPFLPLLPEANQLLPVLINHYNALLYVNELHSKDLSSVKWSVLLWELNYTLCFVINHARCHL